MKKSKLCLLLSILTLSLNLAAAPGDRDVSFGTLGVASFNYGSAIQVVSMEQQADGKTLVLAYTVDANPRIILRRHNTNGSLDTSFGHQGEAVEPSGILYRRLYGKAAAMKINPGDGTIYLTGEMGDPRVAMVWRFTRFGFLDTTYGTNGKQCICGLNVTESFGIDIDVYSNRAVVLYQETKLVNGPSGWVPITYSYLTRLLSSGQIDTSFGVSGYRRLDYYGGSGITLETGGAIYVYGYLISNVALSMSGLKVLRYLSSGAPDTTFPELWYPSSYPDFPDSFLNCNGQHGALRDLIIQPDGRFVNSFYFLNIGGAFIWDTGFVRHERTGVTDFSWGPLPYGVQCDVEVVDLGYAFFGPHRYPHAAVHSDGRVITLSWNSNYPNLKRRFANGTIDTSFQPSYASGLGTAVGVLVQRVDQKIVVLSSFQFVNQYSDIRVLGYKLIRYLP